MKNNGFSLVELIVVVLIMGIIAIALAPQVVKWVFTSRENTDEYSAKLLKSAALTSVAEYESQGKTLKDGKYDVVHSGLRPVGTDQNEGLIPIMQSVMSGECPKVQAEDGKIFRIQFWQNDKKIEVVIVSGSY